jgi:hypothetical protein
VSTLAIRGSNPRYISRYERASFSFVVAAA